MNIEAIQKICKDLEKKNGKGSIFQVGSESSILQIPRMSTKIEDMDEITGGGLPKGRIVEIFGPESSGKTSFAYWLASLCKQSVYIPIEGTYDEDRAKSLGVKNKQMIVFRASYGEEALNATLKFANAGIPLIIIDSVPACQPKEDLEKLEKDLENETRIGGVARLFSKSLPLLVHACEQSGTILVLINQVRDKMNAMLFGEKDDTPGGRAIKFYSSIRIKVARKAWIEVPNKNPKISSNNVKVGMIMKCKVVKSKVCNPFGEAEIPLFFDRGFTSFAELKEIRREIMIQNSRSAKGAKDEEQEED